MSSYDCPNCDKELEGGSYLDAQYPYECDFCGVFHEYNELNEEYEICEAE